MKLMDTLPEAQAALEASKKEAFRRWMNQPMVKAMVSFLPPSEHLEVMLQSCFEGGHEAGAAAMAAEFVRAIMRDKPK